MLGWLGHWILNLVFGLSRGLEFAPLRDDFFSLAVSCPNVFFPFNLHSVYQIYKSVSFIMVVAPSVQRLRNLLRRIDIWTGDDLRWCIFFPVGQLPRHLYPVVHDGDAAVSSLSYPHPYPLRNAFYVLLSEQIFRLEMT